jgi:glycosyltransferase involved in cell wall biosynthesis
MDNALAPRVTLVHDWLTGMRGGEKCLEALCHRYPDARLYTLLHKHGSVSPVIEDLNPRTSFLQRLPHATRYYRYLLPLMPFAARWRIPPCDLVVSMSHCVAKAAQPPAGVPHVCYCFTPMRYAWHLREAYFGGRFGMLKGLLVDRLLGWIREWDRRTSDRVTHFIAISRTIQERIAECYGRDSIVIYPPVDTDFYTPAPQSPHAEREDYLAQCRPHAPREDFYLVVSAFAPYKRIDLAIEACKRLNRRLVVIGTGQDAARLKALAGPGTGFLGWQSDEAIRDHFRRCRALLFPGEEDFGIVPVEANACGTPVIALGTGGATETILPLGASSNPTGVWFEEQQVESLIDAMEKFERNEGAFQTTALRRQALRFNRHRYEGELFGYLDQVMHPRTKQAERRAA